MANRKKNEFPAVPTRKIAICTALADAYFSLGIDLLPEALRLSAGNAVCDWRRDAVVATKRAIRVAVITGLEV